MGSRAHFDPSEYRSVQTDSTFIIKTSNSSSPTFHNGEKMSSYQRRALFNYSHIQVHLIFKPFAFFRSIFAERTLEHFTGVGLRSSVKSSGNRTFPFDPQCFLLIGSLCCNLKTGSYFTKYSQSIPLTGPHHPEFTDTFPFSTNRCAAHHR